MKIHIKYLLLPNIIFLLIFGTIILSNCSAQNNRNTIPMIENIKTLISEAIMLAREINEIGGPEKPKKEKQLYEIMSKLIDFGNEYSRYREYYRDILVRNKDTETKTLAASILDALNDEEFPNILIALLDDENPANRAVAIPYLSDRKDKDAIPKLELLAKSDPDVRIKIMAIKALETIKSDIKNSKDNSNIPLSE